ncbi:MAG: hypothetical protein J0I98_16020 [Mesorhizobium sp.]|nr:hypothetical protein [Mesorhizobium sp.]MBN9244293.1 hypothetical protein [Mesorhizobium sp.]
MTRKKTVAPLSEDDPFAFDESALADGDFDDLFARPMPEDKLTLIAVSLVEDPFTTTRTEDGENPFGGASNLARYERASAAYLAAVHTFDRIDEDDEREEILRRIALYWLRRSQALWSV